MIALRVQPPPILCKTVQVRASLVAHLIEAGHEDRLSPHLLDPEAPEDNTKFMATRDWLAQWMHRLGMSWRAVTGSSYDIPSDHEQQMRASLERIAGKALLWDIPADRVVQADQTFIPYHPSSKCVASPTQRALSNAVRCGEV
jgi:hypothetical protein